MQGEGQATAAATAKAANFDKATVTGLSDEFWLTGEPYDPRTRHEPWKERRAQGKKMRERIPLKVHGKWKPESDRPDPVETIFATNLGRQKDLIPVRLARMTASPFTFYRGAASIMAWDLSRTPTTGFPVVMGGDAHISNFGLYATPQRDVVFDMNDFDEVVIGPWEWDLKRLAASVNIAARENGLKKAERRQFVRMCVRGYYEVCSQHQSLGIVETWSRHTYAERVAAEKNFAKKWGLDPKAFDKTLEVWRKAIEKAKKSTNETLLAKVARQDDKGKWSFAYEPPVLTKVSRAEAKQIIDSLAEYSETLTRERKLMFRRYHVVDVAHRVVGVGSVGIRAYLVLLFGNGPSDPLFLQVKEATEPAHAPFLPNLLSERHPGWRVVSGQRVVQASTDFMLGWTTIDGRPFYIRQMKNMKASIPVELLSGGALGVYALACGGVLARGHARTGDIAKIAGYVGKSAKFENAIADFAEAYADQNDKDHAALAAAVAAGRI
jgi:uncharacterized protein (DUF2252 family)